MIPIMANSQEIMLRPIYGFFSTHGVFFWVQNCVFVLLSTQYFCRMSWPWRGRTYILVSCTLASGVRYLYVVTDKRQNHEL
jgi:hypothetical protein